MEKPNKNWMQHAPAAFAAVLFLAVLLQAPAAQEGARNGLTLSLRTAVPSLFPFFVVSGLLTATGVTAGLGRLFERPLWSWYGLPGAAAGPLLLGLTGGYPVGASSAASLYRAGLLTRAQAERLLGFCNNTGPAFIVGICGVGLLGSVPMGLGLYAVHALSALLTGLALTASPARGVARAAVTHAKQDREPFADLFVRVVRESFSSCLSITAFITVFAILRAVLDATGVLTVLLRLLAPLCTVFGLPGDTAHPLLAGALELTGGLVLLPELHLPTRLLLPVMSALLAFGGLSVWCQTMSVVSGTGLRLRRCFCGKLLHAAIATALATIWGACGPRATPVFADGGTIPVMPLWTLVLPILILLLTFTYGKLHRRRV